MTGRHRLGDGTVITVPMNAAWFQEYGWAVENSGVAPDIPSLRTPLDWAEGRNTQLETAVRTALALLEKHPAATPPDLSDRPDRRRPPLPPRKGPKGKQSKPGKPGKGAAGKDTARKDKPAKKKARGKGKGKRGGKRGSG
jgi:C-terminal processing protease CtpA/Prc